MRKVNETMLECVAHTIKNAHDSLNHVLIYSLTIRGLWTDRQLRFIALLQRVISAG